MGSNILIVSEYLASLKEDSELDYLFPILLKLMGFKVITTPRESKGQPQYGKDVVAVGVDADGIKKKFYFELKGHADKDITDTVMTKPDGIIESLRAAKLVQFKDGSIKGFDTLPVKYVLVHNGVLNSNTRPLFDGFITTEFPGGNFERWGVYELTDFFSKYLFSEYLLTDEESIRLFKRALVLLDAPDYDFSDFKLLVHKQLGQITNIRARSFKKFFATMNLLSVIVLHYSKENNNLEPAKQCITHIVIKVWSWILKMQLSEKAAVINEFKKILSIHFQMLQLYFGKTLETACKQNGLFSERGGPFETIGYPLRAFEYLNYLIYYFEAQCYFHVEALNKEGAHKLKAEQKRYLQTIISCNIGCKRPIIDSHLIAITNVFIFYFNDEDINENDVNFIHDYLANLFNNIIITKMLHDRLPELHDNIPALIEFLTTKERPKEYQDRSSLLILVLFELAAIIDNDDIYNAFKKIFQGKVDLQTSFSNLSDEEFEIALFEKNLHEVNIVESSINLPDDFAEFKKELEKKKLPARTYKTDVAGFPFVRLLAHIYNKNEMLPDEWRRYLIEE